jgi:DNA-binding GntR family transcriptional regulator
MMSSIIADMASVSQLDPRAYVRVAALLRERISCGVLAPGAPLPSITDLCREHGLARGTVRKAVRALEREGLVCRIPGLGYRVDSR